MQPNDKPAIITVAIPLPGENGNRHDRVATARREAETIASRAGTLERSHNCEVLDHLDDDDLDRISARPELQPADTSWLILTAEVHA